MAFREQEYRCYAGSQAQAKLGGGDAAIEAQHDKGKMTARERLARFWTRAPFRSWTPL